MTKLNNFVKIGILTALVAMAGSSARAFTTNVTVEDFDFSPSVVDIGLNDSVTWNWSGNFHTSTSAGLWDSGILNAGGTFTHTFSAGGSFPYLCSIHTFMVGSVNVSAPNSPPTVTITNPVSGAVFAAPWTGTVQANPADTDGTISSVEFFTNSVSAGIVSNAPYNLALSNLASGTYVLKAVATDNASATGASPNISVTVVDPVAVQISDPMTVPQGFRLTYSANTGLVYVVERASVLGNTFAGISTNMATSSSVNFTDTAAISDQKFYRVGRLPNP